MGVPLKFEVILHSGGAPVFAKIGGEATRNSNDAMMSAETSGKDILESLLCITSSFSCLRVPLS